ncbi:Transmembrane protein 62 [Borealophlyctis nickersoniae]|nr:Transmembrane protein 62 [Borealophlyctis nickersoniae]
MSAVQKEGYAYHLHKPFGTYSFIAVDGCPRYGVSRPFNFFGYLDTSDMDFLATELEKSRSHNHTFVMSHYPTATTLFGQTSDGRRFWEVSRDISVWLCGHLHRLFGGLGKTMYAYQDTFLELELADLKVHAVYRIIAVDHDSISFVDLPLHLPKTPMPVPPSHNISISPDISISPTPITTPKPPIVLVTNPKDARYAIPGREPPSAIRESQYIRMLVWSASRIASITVCIDGKTQAPEAEYRGTGQPWRRLGPDGAKMEENDPDYIPLWVVKWDPAVYDDGRDHVIQVTVVDEGGLNGTAVVKFRVDGERILNMESGPGG